MREARKLANGVEMEPIVPSRPAAAELRILLEHHDVDSQARKRGRCGKSGRTPAYDDDGGFGHRIDHSEATNPFAATPESA